MSGQIKPEDHNKSSEKSKEHPGSDHLPSSLLEIRSQGGTIVFIEFIFIREG